MDDTSVRPCPGTWSAAPAILSPAAGERPPERSDGTAVPPVATRVDVAVPLVDPPLTLRIAS